MHFIHNQKIRSKTKKTGKFIKTKIRQLLKFQYKFAKHKNRGMQFVALFLKIPLQRVTMEQRSYDSIHSS
jgi:hypothetical protein